ncbi:hypothetical protein TBS_01590 [Thermobispora bispora]|jgi:quinol monooxygenase YgiN|uniref:Antibiotic biosynthesis monooxygenase n=1 Tax=Thermobispora bispora (strain ATCC 19993 / DSM 43833 / CBS 139.67 / JCM 10125 / KCTC 9307 / NBRC 14880 / R51) TaxID=469371 RepID=D6Y8K6_THEBD|nr:antibiotic biosynthesis monooxygenase family protein [Thermobispora bispora]MBO2473787.1 antibiotic biosynthesis monooxygenase [Actinomycetales bacterium]MDI9579447.1 antibiotic biosynthesis monooxygenase family protein [Thermobispora sp.]ADG87903.1 Antibiotic biosynthesis monooxygenase [Thermobispora bispora DSM 43833]MBX6167379.1 antibiotic biosynthesis monooxygenase [Thermobispora bispora]QSI47783.1 antibiotic biosynthesis monooxygenase [Thermobispora bispora]
MLALIRCTVPAAQADEFLAQAREALAVLAAQPGYLGGRIGRSIDEPNLWVLASEWEGAGFYRRALSAARMAMYPLMAFMINEPGVFEGVYELPSARGPEAEGAVPKH